MQVFVGLLSTERGLRGYPPRCPNPSSASAFHARKIFKWSGPFPFAGGASFRGILHRNHALAITYRACQPLAPMDAGSSAEGADNRRLNNRHLPLSAADLARGKRGEETKRVFSLPPAKGASNGNACHNLIPSCGLNPPFLKRGVGITPSSASSPSCRQRVLLLMRILSFLCMCAPSLPA